MIESFIHISEYDNIYIYDDQHRLSILAHPELKKANEGSINTDPYYLEKYAYLKDHGFFTKPKFANFSILKETVVRDNIINTKQIVFEVTDSCNLNCTYCALGELYEGYDKRIDKKINTRYAINLLEYIFDLKPKNENKKMFISFYGGEALLNMSFIKQIVKVANQLNTEKGMELVFSMTTNATLLHKYIDFLVSNNFRLLISLDGNEKNHSYRVFKKDNKNSFQKVINNIDMIQKDYPEYFSTHVDFNAVLHNRNSVKEIYEFIYTRYKKIPRIAELNMRDIRSDNKDILKKMFNSKRESETKYQKGKIELVDMTHSGLLSYIELCNFLKYFSTNCYISNINALLHTEEKYLPTGTCTPFSKKVFLTNRNKLLPCEKVNYQYSIGKVNENIDIDIRKITEQYNLYYEHIAMFCKNCYAYKFCGTCLFHLKNLDKIKTEEFVCENFYGQKAFKNKLHRIFSFLEKNPKDFSEILENVTIE